MNNEEVLAKGLIERIGKDNSVFSFCKSGNEKIVAEVSVENHKDAVEKVIEMLLSDEYSIIKSKKEIGAIGHRLVHGGEKYADSVLIDDDVIDTLKECSVFSPLHNPANIAGIEACSEIFPGVPMVGVFDTAFHQTMPDYAYMYALPYELYEKHHIRKYGFHGTSHRYVSIIANEILGRKNTKLVSCHLGNGSSVTAILNGKSIDTSMGHTPVGGLIMGTRCGDIDPAIVTYIENVEKLSPKGFDDLINKKSGVLGISGISNDFRDLEAENEKGNKRAKLALEMFDFKLKKYIGAYAAAMEGLDAIIFTAGIGENDFETRYEACKGLEFLGLKLDIEKNSRIKSELADISAPDSKVKVFVIPTNEELMIARDTIEIIVNLVTK